MARPSTKHHYKSNKQENKAGRLDAHTEATNTLVEQYYMGVIRLYLS